MNSSKKTKSKKTSLEDLVNNLVTKEYFLDTIQKNEKGIREDMSKMEKGIRNDMSKMESRLETTIRESLADAKNYNGVLLEDIQHKIELVLEFVQPKAAKIDDHEKRIVVLEDAVRLG